MEDLTAGWKVISELIVWSYLLVALGMAYLFKNPLKTLLDGFFGNVKMVYVVMIISTLVAIPFLLFNGHTWDRVLVTYTLATTLHEAIVQVVLKWLAKRFGWDNVAKKL